MGFVPCNTSPGGDVVVDYPSIEYDDFVFALQTLAHESIHLYDATAGRPAITDKAVSESRAECFGIQRLRDVAMGLGADEAGAAAIASYYWTDVYPRQYVGDRNYWSAECRADGSLDQTPGDGVFP